VFDLNFTTSSSLTVVNLTVNNNSRLAVSRTMTMSRRRITVSTTFRKFRYRSAVLPCSACTHYRYRGITVTFSSVTADLPFSPLPCHTLSDTWRHV